MKITIVFDDTLNIRNNIDFQSGSARRGMKTKITSGQWPPTGLGRVLRNATCPGRPSAHGKMAPHSRWAALAP
jgi:hypothetical protein